MSPLQVEAQLPSGRKVTKGVPVKRDVNTDVIF